MRYILMGIIVSLAVSCGADSKEPGRNGSPNAAPNASENAAPNVARNNTPTNAANGVPNGDANNERNAEPNATPAAPCETRASCATDEECFEGFCTAPWSCDAVLNAGGCGGDWRDCEAADGSTDGKDYFGECDFDINTNTYPCRCLVNDVEVATFVVQSDDYEDCDRAPHRTYNDNCGWLVPEH